MKGERRASVPAGDRINTVAYLVEPRFPGGTSSAVARELELVTDFADIDVHFYSSRMFRSREISKQMQPIAEDPNVRVFHDAERIAADLVVVHNPSFLKFEENLETSIFARHLIVVTHENFQRPEAEETFDVAACLELLERAGPALHRTLAPVSRYNRRTVVDWISGRREERTWSLMDTDWFNICDVDFADPTATPSDRRGRHSRPGLEKFPPLDAMDQCFPETAAVNVILGSDAFIREGIHRRHWKMVPFQGMELPAYFDMIDFMVYFCSPTYRESFGRVISDAICAGKVVITDPSTASVFGAGVVAAQPSEVDSIIQRFIEQPRRYVEQVRRAQEDLRQFSAKAFANCYKPLFRGSLMASA